MKLLLVIAFVGGVFAAVSTGAWGWWVLAGVAALMVGGRD